MKNKYDEALREAFIKSAFTEAASQDIAELEMKDVEVAYPTEKQKREINRRIRKNERRSSFASGRVSRLVAMIAIVLCLAMGMVMSQPTVRASVWDAVVSFFDKYLSFDFGANEPELLHQINNYKITYIPKGFELKESQENPLKATLIFTRGEEVVRITVYPTSMNMATADDEDVKYETLKIGEMDGYIVKRNGKEETQLIWGDDTKYFIIISGISKAEIIKIAESIK